MGNAIPAELIESLLQQEAPRHYSVPEQHGPLRRFEREMRCVSRATSPGNAKNCGSGTFFKVQGIPMCMMHALLALNNLLVEQGIEH